MARITREQFEKWNAQAKNGFSFDLNYYVTWGEKTLTKKIKMENGNIVEFKLIYKDEYETITNSYGCKLNQPTGRKIPNLHVTVWHPSSTSGTFYSGGMGRWEEIGEPQTSQKYSVLCKLSAEINIDNYMPDLVA